MAEKKKSTSKASRKKPSPSATRKAKPKPKARAKAKRPKSSDSPSAASNAGSTRRGASKKTTPPRSPSDPPTRYRRPEPERTGPLRSAAAEGAAESFGPGFRQPGGYPPSADPFQRAGQALAADLESTVGKAVDLGYRVIEDQIRQGRDLAAQLGHGHYDRSPFENPSSGLRGVTVTTMLASLWFDFLGNLVNGLQEIGAGEKSGGFSLESGPPLPWQRPGRSRRASPPGSGGLCSVAVEVDSKRPVAVEIDLEQLQAEQRVAAHLINAADPGAPALTDVLFDLVESSEGAASRPRVRVRVDDDLSGGLYTGVAIDCDNGRHVGSLTIRVAD